jgi:hypothetical protein
MINKRKFKMKVQPVLMMPMPDGSSWYAIAVDGEPGGIIRAMLSTDGVVRFYAHGYDPKNLTAWRVEDKNLRLGAFEKMADALKAIAEYAESHPPEPRGDADVIPFPLH